MIDSWLVEDGRARGLDRHRARFATAVADLAAGRGEDRGPGAPPVPGAADVQRFLDAAIAALPRGGGRWFPRIELVRGSGELRLRVRPAPERPEEVVVPATPFVDRRRAPAVKGPDLTRQAAWKSTVEVWEAGDALLSSPAGTVTEGIWTTPLWWDGDVLCALPRSAPVLDSVTRALLLDLAREHGVAVGRDEPSVARLRDCETWLVNAAQGIARVSGWLLSPGHPPEPAPFEPGRAELWQSRLESLAAPI